jgi:hypothetical protein
MEDVQGRLDGIRELLREAVGRWPCRGLLYPIAGSAVEVELDPAACTQEVTEAVALNEKALRRARRRAHLEK